MKKLILFILIAMAVYGLYYAWSEGLGPFKGSGNITISGDEVTVHRADLEGTFIATDVLSDTYMLFGGTYTAHKNAISPILMAGLAIEEAKGIYESYPDFFMCGSPGASLAKSLISDLIIIPFSSPVLRTLKDAIDIFKQNIGIGGERVCVALEGEQLEMQSVILKQTKEEIGHRFGQKRFYLVRLAEQVECKSLLEDDG